MFLLQIALQEVLKLNYIIMVKFNVSCKKY